MQGFIRNDINNINGNVFDVSNSYKLKILIQIIQEKTIKKELTIKYPN